MKFIANVKSVRADVGSGEVTISMTVDISNWNQVRQLRPYIGAEATSVDLEITPHQLPMFDVELTSKKKLDADPKTGEVRGAEVPAHVP